MGHRRELVTKYKDYGIKGVGDLKKALPVLLGRVEQLHELSAVLAREKFFTMYSLPF